VTAAEPRSGGGEPVPVQVSVLFSTREPDHLGEAGQPAHFTDLRLDQVVDRAVTGRAEYELAPHFYAPLTTVEAIEYRQAVFRDLDQPDVLDAVRSFAEEMREVRRRLRTSSKLRHVHQAQAWFLDAVAVYLQSVSTLADLLHRARLRSPAMLDLLGHLDDYRASQPLTELVDETTSLRQALQGLSYTLLIHGDRVTVDRYADEADYSVEVEATFRRFQQSAPKDYRMELATTPFMNHVEEAILDRVARLFPEVFGPLGEFCAVHRDFMDPTMAAFDREVQFYVAYLEYIEPLRRAGLDFCYPVVSYAKQVAASRTFDLALASDLVGSGAPVVRNDFALRGAERIFVVTGPNQGGKTTFARTLGQLHHLGSLGCPVPGTEANLLLPDRVFTHFERQERVEDLRGKLESDLVRVRTILDQATPQSLVLMNEVFSSTTFEDARWLSERVLGRMIELDLVGVWVTFIDELTTLGPQTVSLVAGIDQQDAARRTFVVERRPADGLAYAEAIAHKHGLTYAQLEGRVQR
jgi:DNA mismatch repair ATPase MutS